MSRQRNNISRLPADVRGRVSMLLDDGATYEEVRTDAEVARACAEKGLTLHDTTFQAWLSGDEHKGYVEARRKFGHEIERRKLAAFVVQNSGGADDMARIAMFEVLRRVIGRLEDGEPLEGRELRSLAASLEGYERNRLAAEARDAKREADREIEKYRSRVAELEAKVAELSGAKAGSGSLSDEQIDEIRRRLGV